MAECQVYKPKNKSWSYTKTKTSYNDNISSDVESTVKDWMAEGWTKFTDDISQFPDNTKARYVTQRGGEIKARLGGIIIDNYNGLEYQYLKFHNPTLGRSWSVQYSDISSLSNPLIGLYVKNEAPKAPATIAKPDKNHIMVVPSMPAYN